MIFSDHLSLEFLQFSKKKVDSYGLIHVFPWHWQICGRPSSEAAGLQWPPPSQAHRWHRSTAGEAWVLNGRRHFCWPEKWRYFTGFYWGYIVIFFVIGSGWYDIGMLLLGWTFHWVYYSTITGGYLEVSYVMGVAKKNPSHGWPWLSIETHGNLGIPHFKKLPILWLGMLLLGWIFGFTIDSRGLPVVFR